MSHLPATISQPYDMTCNFPLYNLASVTLRLVWQWLEASSEKNGFSTLITVHITKGQTPTKVRSATFLGSFEEINPKTDSGSHSIRLKKAGKNYIVRCSAEISFEGMTYFGSSSRNLQVIGEYDTFFPFF